MAEANPPVPSGPMTDMDDIASAMDRFANRPAKDEAKPPEAAAPSPDPQEAEEPEEGVEPVEEEAAEEEPSEEETDTEADPDVELRLDEQGNPVTVKLSELRKGYLRQSDYTRKTQELAEGRRVIEQVAQQIAAQRQQLAQEYGETLNQLRMQLPPDDSAEMAELEQTDPGEWSKRELRKRQQQSVLQQALARKAQLEQQEYQQQVQREASMLAEKVPEWKDRSKAAKDMQDIERFACETYGFTPDVLASVVDHRFVLLARDAMTGRRATRKAAELKPALKALPKIQRPGAVSAPSGDSDGLKRSIQRLQSTGGRNIDDIAAAFAALGRKRPR